MINWLNQVNIEEDTGKGVSTAVAAAETKKELGEIEEGFPTEGGVGLGRPLTPVLLQRRHTYGSCELGTVRAKARMDGADGPMHARFRARVLHRFPAYDHEESAFPSNLSLFCLPGESRVLYGVL